MTGAQAVLNAPVSSFAAKQILLKRKLPSIVYGTELPQYHTDLGKQRKWAKRKIFKGAESV